MKKQGFTLIELLIVIALLGALAIGLLATIDPFEQLKKGRDTATRNTATEYYNAALRYYGTKGQFPWGTTNTLNDTLDNLTDSWTLELQNAGELKQNFATVADTRLARIHILTVAPYDNMTICFTPESKNFRLDPNTIYDATGGPGSNCGTGTSSNCYWCIK